MYNAKADVFLSCISPYLSGCRDAGAPCDSPFRKRKAKRSSIPSHGRKGKLTDVRLITVHVGAIGGAPLDARWLLTDSEGDQVQREGDVIHVVVHRLDDLSPLLASVGQRPDVASIYQVSRADVVRNAMVPDPRDPAERPLGRKPRDLYDPDLRLGSGIIPGRPSEGIKIKPRDFR